MNSFKLILASVGKEYLWPKFYRKGKPLDSHGSDYEPVTVPDQSVRMNSAAEGCNVMSMFGQPVWADIILKDNIEGGRQLQLTWALITVSRSKNIVKTIITGSKRDGTVKEFINNSDYEVSIEGGIFDENPTRFPVEDMNTLIYLSELKEAIPVISEYLQLFGIHELVISTPKFKPSEGAQNIQVFTMDCLSDTPIELVEE